MSTERSVRIWVRDLDMAAPAPFDIAGPKVSQVPGWINNPSLFHRMMKNDHGINTFGPVFMVIEGGLASISEELEESPTPPSIA